MAFNFRANFESLKLKTKELGQKVVRDTKKNWRRHKNLVVLLLLATVLWYFLGVKHYYSYVTVNGKINKDKADEASAYGDSFGYVNTLFSGLAFAGVIYTIFLQTTELKYQRKEIRDNRKELKATADANKQLVNLNALAALVQYYLGDADRRGKDAVQSEYDLALLRGEDEGRKTDKFKTDFCISEIERLYSEASQQPFEAKQAPDATKERRRAWHRYFIATFVKAKDAYSDEYKRSKLSNVDIAPLDYLECFSNLSNRFSLLLACLDALRAEREEYEKLINHFQTVFYDIKWSGLELGTELPKSSLLGILQSFTKETSYFVGYSTTLDFMKGEDPPKLPKFQYDSNDD